MGVSISREDETDSGIAQTAGRQIRDTATDVMGVQLTSLVQPRRGDNRELHN